MRNQQTLTAMGPATVAQAPAGGSALAANPALGSAANGLLVANNGCPAWFRIAGATNTAPAPMQGDSATVVNPGGQVLLTDAASLAAPMFQVCGGTLSITAVAVTGSTLVNS